MKELNQMNLGEVEKNSLVEKTFNYVN